MADLLIDDFNRANSTNNPGTPQVGGPYTVRAGTWGIIGNELYTSSSTANALLTFPAAFDVEVSFKIGLMASSGVVARYVDANNFWYVGWDSGNVATLFRRTAGTLYGLGSSRALSVWDTLTIVGFGGYVYGLRNGQLFAAAEDGFVASTPTAAGVRINSSTSARIDDLAARDATTRPGGLEGATAAMVELTYSETTPISTGFVYKGRDTKTADEGAVS